MSPTSRLAQHCVEAPLFRRLLGDHYQALEESILEHMACYRPALRNLDDQDLVLLGCLSNVLHCLRQNEVFTQAECDARQAWLRLTYNIPSIATGGA